MKKWIILFIGSFTLFVACNSSHSKKDTQLSEVEYESYLTKGQNIASSTFVTLSTHLNRALTEGGIPKAIQYCNTATYSLVDSLSNVHNAIIRRTSHKIRNPSNEPSEKELEALQYYESSDETQLQPFVQKTSNGEVTYYAPIKIQPLCLNCHGKLGMQLTKENYDIIKKYYPDDNAFGYELGNLRGVWSIQFNN